MTVGLTVDVTALRLIRSNRLFWRSFRGVKKVENNSCNTQAVRYSECVMSEGQ